MGKEWENSYICAMATIKFIVRGKSETASIYVRFKEGRLFDVTAKTNYIIDSKDWSETKGQPKKDESLKKLDNDLKDLKTAGSSLSSTVTFSSLFAMMASCERDYLLPYVGQTTRDLILSKKDDATASDAEKRAVALYRTALAFFIDYIKMFLFFYMPIRICGLPWCNKLF